MQDGEEEALFKLSNKQGPYTSTPRAQPFRFRWLSQVSLQLIMTCRELREVLARRSELRFKQDNPGCSAVLALFSIPRGCRHMPGQPLRAADRGSIMSSPLRGLETDLSGLKSPSLAAAGVSQMETPDFLPHFPCSHLLLITEIVGGIRQT